LLKKKGAQPPRSRRSLKEPNKIFEFGHPFFFWNNLNIGMMISYEAQVKIELDAWKIEMQKNPGMFSRLSKSIQRKINALIPDKVHAVITTAIKQMFKTVISGSELTNPGPGKFDSFQKMEIKALERIRFYTNSAATEGAITGAGGILLGLADFPLWLTLKMKMLYELASLYGHDVKDLRERLFILQIFQITFSSQVNRNKIFPRLEEFEIQKEYMAEDLNDFDWKSFQIDYRDYLDIAKMLQLIPGIGAVVGAVINHRLTKKLGRNAMNGYRLRLEGRKYPASGDP
jgi:uncharacterized protein (DUF697 family)